ncbi:MAG: class B sortase [Clostridia bacterium]|nr:class B sortase [Clostridia bacterium]
MSKIEYDDEYTYEEEQKDNRKRAILIILIILLFLICSIGAVYLAWNIYNLKKGADLYSSVRDSYVDTDVVVEDNRPENPIDFASLKQRNSDVYAWLVVPNTKINYPILQNETTDFYLRRSIDKGYLFAGCIYTNKVNSKDFTDPVTLVYGHNMRDDTMFCMLHRFEDEKFFKENKYFYIYTPDSKLTYEIVSALKYDNRRITTAYDFTDPEQLQAFHYSILNPKYELFNSRNIELTLDTKIVTLSTCVANRPSYRYLVNGVLIDNEPTK